MRLVKFKLNCKCNNLPPCTVSVYPQKINNRFVPYKEEFDNHGWKLHLLVYFKRGCRKKCACDNPKGNMGYYQHTVPETIAVEPTFVAFLSHSQTYVHGWPLMPFFQISLKNRELKTIYNTFQDCCIHFFQQPFLK